MYQYLTPSQNHISSRIKRKALLSNSQVSAIRSEVRLAEVTKSKSNKLNKLSFKQKIKIGNYVRFNGRAAGQKKFHISYNTAKKYGNAVIKYFRNNPDVSVNKPWKGQKKLGFTTKIAADVTEQIAVGIPFNQIVIDTKVSTLKPLFLESINAWNYINNNPTIVANGMASSLGFPSYNARKESERWGIPLV